MYKSSLILIIVFLVLAPYLLIPDITLYDSKRVLQLVLIGFLSLIALATTFKLRGSKHYNNYYWPTNSFKLISVNTAIYVLVISGLLSVIFSIAKSYAFLEYTFYFLLLALVLFLLPGSKRQHYNLGSALVISAVLYAGIYIIIFTGNYISSFLDPMIILWPEKYNFSLVIDGEELRGKEVLYFVHRRFFNHTQTWTLPILLGVLSFYQLKNNKQVISYSLFSLITFWWMLVIASGGRGTFVSVVFSLVLLFFFWRKEVFPILKNTFSTLLSGGLLYLVLYKLIPGTATASPILRTTDSGRFEMWARAIEMWIQHPIFGAGPLHYARIIDEPYASHPHNFYLQFLSEWGIISFLTLALLIAVLIVSVFNNFHNAKRNNQNKFFYIGVSWALLSALTHSFFSGVMHTPMSQIWLVLVLAWLIGFNRNQHSVNIRLPFYRSKNLLLIILTLIVLLMSVGDILSLTEYYSIYMAQYPGESFYPRFWNEGLIPK
jgi:hypothetical protein